MEDVVGAPLDRRVAAELLRRLERGLRVRRVAGPEQRDPAIELHERVARILEPEPLHRVDAPVRPLLERHLDLRAGTGPRFFGTGGLPVRALGWCATVRVSSVSPTTIPAETRAAIPT